MADLVLRVKTKSGQKVVNGLSSSSTVGELKLKLSDLTGVDVNSLHVLNGFPPKVLDLSNLNSVLSDTGIVTGDTLIVEEKINLSSDEIKSRSHAVDTERFVGTPGTLMKKIVPADNSCLFTSVGYVLGGKIDPNWAQFMRVIISKAVACDPEKYCEAILGKPNSIYCHWILKPESWGGAIELSILSKFYKVEIVVVNSVNGTLNRFGEDRQYPERVFLIFDGIHYDPLYLEPHDGGSMQTTFPIEDERILLEASQLAKEAKSSRQYTDVQNLTVKCLVCNIHLSGQTAASQHAKDTGHMNFGEIAQPH